MQPVFITGIGTDVGKTIAAAIITEALEADYWKPVQAGFEDGTDALTIQSLISNSKTKIHPEVYKLTLPASPHIAAREENILIDTDAIKNACENITSFNKYVVIEGAGGLLVPLNETEFVSDLIVKLNATTILVSRNYLGSINHSLLTAEVCAAKKIRVAGWIFNDQYMNYADEIAAWSGLPEIGHIPFAKSVDTSFIREQADFIRPALMKALNATTV